MIKELKKTRTILFLIEIIVVFFICQTPGFAIAIYGVKPNALLLVALNIALFESPSRSLGTGIICGFFMDMGFGEYFGFYITVISIGCFLVSVIKDKLKSMNILTAYIFSVCFSSIVLALSFCFIFVVNSINDFLNIIALRYLLSFVYTIVFEVVFYYISKGIVMLTAKKKKEMRYLMIKNTESEYSGFYNFLGSE